MRRLLKGGEKAGGRRTVLTLCVGGVGATLAALAGFPAPYLLGPAALVTVAGLGGLSLGLPRFLINAAMVAVGMSIGSGVTPDVLESARQWPLSFAMLALSLIVIMVVCSRFLRRVFAYDPNTALLASSPGHLSYVLSLSSDVNADIRQISLVQSIRVLAITLIVPFVVIELGGTPGGAAPATIMSVPAIVFTLFLSVALGLVLQAFRLPAALLIGAMTISTLVHLTGAVEGALPNWITLPSFLVMGTMIGTRFSGVDLHMIRKSFSAGACATLISGLLAALFSLGVAVMMDLPPAQLLLAFVPGGVESMIAMAVLLGADPAFVAAHHVARLFMLSVLVPIMLGRGARSA